MTEHTTTGTGEVMSRKTVEGRAERVTFFEDRAEVVRRVQLEIPAGTSWVTITGVALVVDDTTVVARVEPGHARVLGTRVLRQTRSEPEATAQDIATLEGEARAARRARRDAELAVERAAAHERRLGALMDGLLEAVARVPKGEGKLGTWKPGYDELDRVTLESLDEASEARVALQKARVLESRAESRLSAARAVHPRYEAAIEVQLDAASPQQLGLEVAYRVPCALWRPEHLFRVVRKADGAGFELHVRTWATVWQQTGESWDGVACRFSTARPARSASPPLLQEDIVRSRKKTDLERRQVVLEVRDQAIEVSRLERGARAVEEMPGVDDGGEPQWFEASRPATIPGDGHPFRVEIGSAVIPCQVDWIAYPERSEGVSVRATATWTGTYPLLAGPAWVAREGELAGRSRIKFIPRGEPFEIGVGLDDGLRIRRTREEKRDTAAVVGTQKVTREVQVFVTNLGSKPRRLKVVERFPVSEIEAVSVSLLSAEGAVVDGRDGFASYEVEMAGNSTRTLKLAYRIEASSNVVLPF